MRALHERSPGHYEDAEAAEVIALAETLPQEKCYAARSMIEAAYNTAMRRRGLTLDEGAKRRFETFLHGPGRAVEPVPNVGRPRRTGGTTAGLRPLRELDPRLEAYDPASLAGGIPSFLARGAALDELFYSFAGQQPDSGSGAHLGGGLVVTARHVIDQFLARDVFADLDAPEGWVGDQALPAGMQGWSNEAGWSVRGFPPKGKYDNSTRRVIMRDGDFGAFNDIALLRSEAHGQRRGLPGIRATGDLAPGERLYIVGDLTAGRLRVTTGTLGEIAGNNAILENAKVEAGFSGSPVMDASGNLVGVLCVKLGRPDAAMMVTTETLTALLEEAGLG